jgi:uncharacterized protein (TIGR03000 family)
MYSIVLAAFLTTGNDAAAFGRRHGCRGGGVSYSAGCFGCWGGYSSGCYGSWGGCYGSCSGGCGGGVSVGGGCGGGVPAGGGYGGGVGGASDGFSGSGSAGGGGSSSTEVTQSIKELKKSVAELKEEQTKVRLEKMKSTVDELRAKETEQKINELRRSIEELKLRVAPATVPVPLPIPLPGPRTPPELPVPRAGKVMLDLPADALLFVNDKLVAAAPLFTTPPLEPGKKAVYDFEVNVLRDGKSITRTKRLTLRAGEVVRLAYADMKADDGAWTTEKTVASPAHITVRLAADAKLTVDDLDCPLTSSIRTFDTPALAPGQKYYYILTVKERRGGRTVEQSRRVVFRSGERVTVSFDNAAGSNVTAR